MIIKKSISLTLSVACLLFLGVQAACAQESKEDTGTVYLADRIPVAVNGEHRHQKWLNDQWRVGTALLHGQKFEKSISWRTYDGVSGSNREAVFLTGLQYDYLEAVVGISDRYANGEKKLPVLSAGR